jgi:predicted GTPase
VIGPQSSGKSLLLNTLFGAQFLSSAGRCTRGIYGCLIDIKCDVK